VRPGGVELPSAPWRGAVVRLDHHRLFSGPARAARGGGRARTSGDGEERPPAPPLSNSQNAHWITSCPPRGTACRLSLCVVHRGPKGPQDGPGCATPAVGDPCRTRTCIRCARGSRPTAGRTGRMLPDGTRRARTHFGRWSRRSDPNGRSGPRRVALCSVELRRDGARGQIQTDNRGTAGPVPFHSITGHPRRETVFGRAVATTRPFRPICWRSLQLSRCYLAATNQGICANSRHTRRAQGIPRLRRG
jgi:hypothetical protein